MASSRARNLGAGGGVRKPGGDGGGGGIGGGSRRPQVLSRLGSDGRANEDGAGGERRRGYALGQSPGRASRLRPREQARRSQLRQRAGMPLSEYGALVFMASNATESECVERGLAGAPDDPRVAEAVMRCRQGDAVYILNFQSKQLLGCGSLVARARANEREFAAMVLEHGRSQRTCPDRTCARLAGSSWRCRARGGLAVGTYRARHG